jgi:hypothetical protein
MDLSRETMSCNVCGRLHNVEKLPFLCVVDARNELYEHRFAHAHALIEREKLENQANTAIVEEGRFDTLQTSQQLSADRTNQIIAQADRLRQEVEQAKKDLAKRRAALRSRKADFDTVTEGVDARRARQLKEMETSISVVKYKWRQIAEITATNRAYLCMEAARLYGLRRVKKANVAKYEIGHVEMVELFGMNSKTNWQKALYRSGVSCANKQVGASPEAISTSLASIAHILVLASHYLAIRLPAEITLPQREYPRPTIFSLSSSYHHPEVPFPGSNPLQLHPSQDTTQSLPRPRPLYVDKPLPVLAKENMAVYNAFIEGVTLLAYDISWACCSQGIALSDRDEDICNMGQNLYRLLIGNQLINNPTAQIYATSAPAGEIEELKSEKQRDGKAKNLMGYYSHGGAYGNLATAEGAEFVRSFKLASPKLIADRVKSKLLYEAPMLEWENIDSADALTADEEGDGVLVKGRRRRESAGGRPSDAESALTSVAIAPRADSDHEMTAGKRKASGASGWTKLKSR